MYLQFRSSWSSGFHLPFITSKVSYWNRGDQYVSTFFPGFSQLSVSTAVRLHLQVRWGCDRSSGPALAPPSSISIKSKSWLKINPRERLHQSRPPSPPLIGALRWCSALRVNKSAACWISAEVTDASYPTQHHRGTGDTQHTNEPPSDIHRHQLACMFRHKYAYVNTDTHVRPHAQCTFWGT